MKQIHVIRIETQGGDGRLMVNIYSDYFGQKIPIPMNNEPGSFTPAIDTAKKHLEKLGYTFTNYCAGKFVHYLVSEDFIKIAE